MANSDHLNDNSADFRRRIELLSGLRQMSIAALRERIETQFNAELPPDVARQLSPEDRRERLREITDYILETEVIRLPRQDKLALIDVLYADLFQFGVLDPLLTTPDVTEIVIDGAAKIHMRRGQGEAQLSGFSFDSEDDYRRVLARALNGVALPDESRPFVETGTMLLGRRARLTLAAPPVSPYLHTEIRLHPLNVPTLDALIAEGFIDAAGAEKIRDAIQSGRGIMIAGDVATGKTTLLQALLPELPAQAAIVERAAEIALPDGMQGFSGEDFTQQIANATAKAPGWLAIDEIRFDESQALLDVFQNAPELRLLWVFRGATRADRLLASFGMSIRRAAPAIESSEIVRWLVERLPLVVLCGRRKNQQIGVIGLNEWHVVAGDPERADLQPV